MDEGSYLVYAILCFAVAFSLFAIDVFVPSGGIISIIGAIAALGGIVFFFLFNQLLGLVVLIACLVAIPFAFEAMSKILPRTFMAHRESGTRLTGNDDSKKEGLVGAVGEAMTDLHPVGTCRIKGERVECLANDGVIRAKAKVRVVSADGMQIKVVEEG